MGARESDRGKLRAIAPLGEEHHEERLEHDLRVSSALGAHVVQVAARLRRLFLRVDEARLRIGHVVAHVLVDGLFRFAVLLLHVATLGRAANAYFSAWSPSIIMRTPKNTNYAEGTFTKGDTRTAATTTESSRDMRIGAARPMAQEITHITTKARTEPRNTSHRLCVMARIAPIKNVLSPISILRIMMLVLENPANHLFDLSLAETLVCVYKKRAWKQIRKVAQLTCEQCRKRRTPSIGTRLPEKIAHWSEELQERRDGLDPRAPPNWTDSLVVQVRRGYKENALTRENNKQ